MSHIVYSKDLNPVEVEQDIEEECHKCAFYFEGTVLAYEGHSRTTWEWECPKCEHINYGDSGI